MSKFKFFAASVASLTIIALTPIMAYAGSPACTACFGNCIAVSGGDEYLYSQCASECRDEYGTLCMIQG